MIIRVIRILEKWRIMVKFGPIFHSKDSLWKNTRIAAGSLSDSRENLLTDPRNRLLSYPNPLKIEDWLGWLFVKAYGTISVSNGAEVSIELKNREGKPVVVSWNYGKGKVTMVALNLNTHLMGVVPGAYKLPANFISF